MTGVVACTAEEAISTGFIIRELIKQIVGIILLTVYLRLIYVLIKEHRVFSNVFYKLVVINGIAVKFRSVVKIMQLILVLLLTFVILPIKQISIVHIFVKFGRKKLG